MTLTINFDIINIKLGCYVFYSWFKLVVVTLFQRLSKVCKPKLDSRCIAPIAYYITNKKKFQVIRQKYFCQMTFFFWGLEPVTHNIMPYTLVCCPRIRLSSTGGVTNLASNACATAQANFRYQKLNFGKSPKPSKIKRIFF